MTIAGTVYPSEIPEESATKRMLSLSPHFPKSIWAEGKIELGSAFPKNATIYLPIFSQIRVLFEGNLYNQEEILQEIEQHHFKATSKNSDEELIATLYSIHREHALSFLNGNFALALYDVQKQELLLARDRLGEKNLYWSLRNQHFLFANSLKGMLASGLISQTPDLEALSFFISFGFIPQERSPIQKVFKLQPGHFLKFSKEQNLLIQPYWSYNVYLQKQKEFSEEELKNTLSNAWKKRITSSTVLCYTEKCTSWENQAGVALQLYSPQKKLKSPSDLFSEFYSMIWHLEEPISDLSLLTLWQNCKQIKASGHSELFFTTGSESFLKQEIHRPRLSFLFPLETLQRILKKRIVIPLLHKLHSKTVYPLLRSIHMHSWHTAFLNQSTLFDKTEFSDLHSHLLHPVNNELFLHRFPALKRLGPSYRSLMYLYHKIRLPAVIFPEEKFCSHFGITRKAPYLDQEVIEILASTTEHHYNQMFSSTSSASRISKLPAWATEISIAKLTEKLSKSILVEAGLFSPLWLSEQLKNFNRHPHLFIQELWGLLTLEIWFQQFIENRVSQPDLFQNHEHN